MIPASCHPAQPADWRREYREAIDDPRELLRRLALDDLAGVLLAADGGGFPLRVPLAYLARMRRGDPHDPLLRQVLPLDAELRAMPGFTFDAVGDGAARTAPGLLRKYHGRALVIATGSCAIHCRYCFRRHFAYADNAAAASNWRAVLDALASDPSLEELILSGGDPLSLATSKLRELGTALRTVPQVKRLRVHTRLPIVLPARVDAELLDWVRGSTLPIVFMLHANHANEIDAAVCDAIAALNGAGARVLNQSVLLAGVNDSVDALAALSERLFEAGALPVYLHLLDRVVGTAHFEVAEARAVALHRELRARLPGYLVPELLREVVGAVSKTPVY
jgi:EF-P beta-lysylation protein EpmB